jgi:hypothetical protein
MPATITRRGASSGIVSRGPTPEHEDFRLSFRRPDPVVISGDSTMQENVGDLVYQNYTGATIDHEAVVLIEPLTDLHGVTLENLTPEIATLDETNGYLSREADGTAIVLAHSRFRHRRIDVPLYRESGQATQELIGFVAGSLIRETSDAIDLRIAGLTPSVAKPIFSTQNHAAGTYVRSEDCWAADLDLTGISPWNSNLANRRAGTLVSRRHFIAAWHYRHPVGTVLRFIAGDNQAVERTMTARARVGTTDIMVGLLDEDLPETIAHYKVFPADVEDYFYSLGTSYCLPTLGLDQQEKALVQDCFLLNTAGQVYCKKSVDPTRGDFWEQKISGDSGNPCFAIVDDELVLLTTWWGADSGPGLHNYIDEVNSVMSSLGGGYELTVKDLSGFPNYT